MTTKFTVNKQEYNIKIGYRDALETLPEKFGLSITKLLVDDDETNNVVRSLLMDDEKLIQIMWYYMQDTTTLDYGDFIEVLTPLDVNTFREKLWEEISNFSGPLKQPMMVQAWAEAKRYLKKAQFDSSDSESNQEA